MHPLIEKKRKWKCFNNENIQIWYIGNIVINSLKKFLERTVINKNLVNEVTLKKEISKFKGNFALICLLNKSKSFAFVDRIKSYPVYVGKTKNGISFSNHSPCLLKKLKKKKYNSGSILSIRMSGYSIGRETLYSEIIQLLLGEFCILDKKKSFFKITILS